MVRPILITLHAQVSCYVCTRDRIMTAAPSAAPDRVYRCQFYADAPTINGWFHRVDIGIEYRVMYVVLQPYFGNTY